MNTILRKPGNYLLLAFLCLVQISFAQINVTVSVTPPSCNGFTNGSATALASGGNGAYSYSWSNGQSGQSTFGLAAGTISVTVTDTDGNTGTRSASVTAPAALTATFAQGGSGCAPTNGGTVSVSGGTGPYTYSWDNGQTSATVSNLASQSTCVNVTDARGCSQVFCFNVNSALTVTVDNALTLCPGGCDAVLIAEVQGGTGPYTYLWDDGFRGAIHDMLIPGRYCVTVTDANGCTAQGCGVVGEPAPITVTFTSTQPNCGSSNGSVTATASGGTAPYTYSYGTGSTGATLNNIGAGSYTVNITDANGCSGSASVTLTAGNLVVSVTPNSPPCGAGAIGSATAVVTGGTAPFTYSWSSGSTSSTAGNLAPGMYTVTVTDANGCTGSASTTITAGSTLTVTATSTPQLCGGSATGSASVLVSGGTAPYLYSWTNGSTESTIANLAPGTYTVTVTDANGCSGTASATVAASTTLFCTVTTIQAISAPGANDGILTAMFSGGVMPYTITWDNGSTGQTITGLAPGTYTATVRDGNGCTSTCSGILSQPVIAALSKIGDFVFRDLNNNGQQDVGEPGVANVRVELTNPDGSISRQSSDANGKYCFGDLTPGQYKVTFEILVGNDRFTIPNVGNDETDSDAVPMNIPFRQVAMTGTVTLNPGDTILTLDAGIVDACIPVTSPGAIVATQTSVCGIGADPGPINSVTPAMSTGALRYLWMVNDQNDPNFANWMPAPGTNNQESYDPGAIYENTFFARCVFGVNCNAPAESNVVLITVGTDSRAIISGPNLVCVGSPYTFEATSAGGGAVYSWDFGPRANPQTSSNRTVSVTWDLFGNRNVQLTVTRLGCVTTATQRVSISTCFANAPFVIATNRNGKNAVMVDWSMENELVAGKYMVQRSGDGGVTYSTIAEVPASLGSGLRSYNYMDMSPKIGYNTYRVYRVLEAGDTYFSDVSSLSFFSREVDFVAYPNPAVDRIVLERYDNLEQARTVDVVDQNGRIISTTVFPAHQNRLELDLSGTASGQLHVRMSSNVGVINSLTVTRQ